MLSGKKKENTLNVGNRNELSFKLQQRTHLKLQNVGMVASLEDGLDLIKKKMEVAEKEEMDRERMFKTI